VNLFLCLHCNYAQNEWRPLQVEVKDDKGEGERRREGCRDKRDKFLGLLLQL